MSKRPRWQRAGRWGVTRSGNLYWYCLELRFTGTLEGVPITRHTGPADMGHTEHIIAEIATLDAAEQARLLSFVRELKAARTLSAQQLDDQARLSAALAPFRVTLADYRFDREEANARR